MAWTAPQTWTVGQVVTASDMNTDVRDNMLETAPAKAAAAGDMFYATAVNAITNLGIGTAGQLLAVNSGASAPEWADTIEGDLTWTSTDSGSIGPQHTLYHDSASPVGGDAIGYWLFDGNNTSGTQTTYGQIQALIGDTTAGSEGGRLRIWSMVGGSLTLAADFADGLLRLPAGSASAPSMNFGLASDADTGVFRDAADELGLVTGGSIRHRITNTETLAFSDETAAGNSIWRWISDYSSATNLVARVMADGDLENDNNSYGAISDERIKSNKRPARSYWSDFAAVPVRKFTLDKTGADHIGPIAQEVKSVFPGLVRETVNDGEGPDTLLSVKHSILYGPIMGRVVQEAQERIEALEQRVEQLEAA